MGYSIKPVLHHIPDKNGLHKIQIQILCNRMKFTIVTNYKVKPGQFENERCKDFKNCNDVNRNLMVLTNKYEKILLSVMDSKPDKETLFRLFKGLPEPVAAAPVVTETTFAEYMKILIERYRGKYGKARLIHYNTLANQIKNFNDLKLKDVSPKTALQIEQYLRSLGFAPNTLNTKMKIFIAVINQAKIDKLVDMDCMLGYKKPPYIQSIPDYLIEPEIKSFKKIVDATTVSKYKVAGNYFLLSCYTGFRISDLRKFKYDEAVRDGKIIIRAKKNGSIVSIAIYPALAEILEEVKKYPFHFTEQSMRKYVKEIAMMAGLGRKIKVHTARHTFAMMLMNKGFTQDEVAELLGDDKNVARIYARVTNTQLDNKIRERLF